MNTNNYTDQERLGLVVTSVADPQHDTMPRYATLATVQRKLQYMSQVILWTNYGDDGNLPSCCFLEITK
jgi:hypothetical protein